jgi:hypothetical protein
VSKGGNRIRLNIRKPAGSDGGVSFQLPKGWDDGSGKVRHVKDGPLKGRVYFTSREEAKELAKRLQDKEERHVRYDS